MSTPTDAGDEALDALERAEDTTDKESREGWALVAIGYAVLDLASALREGRDT